MCLVAYTGKFSSQGRREPERVGKSSELCDFWKDSEGGLEGILGGRWGCGTCFQNPGGTRSQTPPLTEPKLSPGTVILFARDAPDQNG